MSMQSSQLALRIRQHALRMVHAVDASHIGGALSMADMLAVLYHRILRVRPDNCNWPERDRFILSKGHACAGLYAALAECGFFPTADLTLYGRQNSSFMTHISHKVPGVEFSTGSLGHGLPFGCGKALSAKRRKQDWRVFVMLSDGELDEGSNWEAILFAPQHRLDNLIAIIDYNKMQSLGTVGDVMDLAPLADKFRAFRWAVREIDGHNHQEINDALLSVPWETGRPNCVIAHTVKGKGVDFMENKVIWHYKSPNDEELKAALRQLGCGT